MLLDLHVHLRGTISPPIARALAKRSATQFDESLVDSTGQFQWSGFEGFLQAYDRIGDYVRSSSDLEFVTHSYLVSAAAEGTLYVEFMLSPPDLVRDGIPYLQQLSAIRTGAAKAKAESGIECRLIATCVRHLGPDAALKAAQLVCSLEDPIVVGFGMTGNELEFEIEDFAPAFDVARKFGLRLTTHAGEHRAADSVRRAINTLGVHRIGHGIRASEDVDTMLMLKAKKIGLEICLSSNIRLGLCNSIEEHPIRTLVANDVLVALGTDDPAFFSSSLANEYQLARKALPTTNVDLVLSRNAIEMAFCDEKLKAVLAARLAEAWRS